MSKELSKELETGTETGTVTEIQQEIEIPIENQEPGDQELQTTTPTKVKDISKLTLEERAKIISDARNGIPNEHYDVIVLKNGNTRIVKKKIKTPSLSNRLINEQKQNLKEANNSKKLYMSDNQLMMEHIIELNNQVNKLANKHKKLKKKYRALKHDIYEEDFEQESQASKDVVPSQDVVPSKDVVPSQEMRRTWRSYLTYL